MKVTEEAFDDWNQLSRFYEERFAHSLPAAKRFAVGLPRPSHINMAFGYGPGSGEKQIPIASGRSSSV
jgi:hypothetical protein